MKTSTENSPTSSRPCTVSQPPSSSVAVNPDSTAIRISGLNADE